MDLKYRKVRFLMSKIEILITSDYNPFKEIFLVLL